MYSGLDKTGGGVVGGIVGEECAPVVTAGEGCETAGAEETLVGQRLNADGTTSEVLLQSRLDEASGGLTWVPLRDEEASLAWEKTMAYSQMSSMLKDDSRNQKYHVAITAAVKEFIQDNARPPIVLDIGSGTGLLSMIAARAGAQEVHACEMNATLARVSAEVTALNFPEGTICIHNKLSTCLTVGEGCDMPQRADMLINEVYDSVLLGEGVLAALQHAVRCLLVPGAAILPQSAKVWGRLVSSSAVRSCHDISSSLLAPGVPMARDARAAACTGGRSNLTVHEAALRETGDLHDLSEPFEVFTFNFELGGGKDNREGCSSQLPEFRSRLAQVEATDDGELDAVLLWWDLHLQLKEPAITYTTAEGVENWQDHWVQTLVPIPGKRAVSAGEKLEVLATHGPLSMSVALLDESEYAPGSKRRKRMDASRDSDGYRDEREEPFDPCGCGWHVLCNLERLAQLNNADRFSRIQAGMERAFKRLSSGGSVKGGGSTAAVIDVGDGSRFGAAAAVQKLAQHVVTVEGKDWSNLLIQQAVCASSLEEQVTVIGSAEEWPLQVAADAMIGEPFFYQMHALDLMQVVAFWYQRACLTRRGVLSPKALVVPAQAIVFAAAIAMEDPLVHGPVGSVQGFNHAPYDDALHRVDWSSQLYPYALWNYRHNLLSKPTELLRIDFSQDPHDLSDPAPVALELTKPGACNAIAVWANYKMCSDDQDDESLQLSSYRPYGKLGGGKQHLLFLKEPIDSSDSSGRPSINVRASFSCEAASIQVSLA
ncbi:unnamed protein product [Chrysoparadoxa australica]